MTNTLVWTMPKQETMSQMSDLLKVETECQPPQISRRMMIFCVVGVFVAVIISHSALFVYTEKRLTNYELSHIEKAKIDMKRQEDEEIRVRRSVTWLYPTESDRLRHHGCLANSPIPFAVFHLETTTRDTRQAQHMSGPFLKIQTSVDIQDWNCTCCTPGFTVENNGKNIKILTAGVYLVQIQLLLNFGNDPQWSLLHGSLTPARMGLRVNSRRRFWLMCNPTPGLHSVCYMSGIRHFHANDFLSVFVYSVPIKIYKSTTLTHIDIVKLG